MADLIENKKTRRRKIITKKTSVPIVQIVERLRNLERLLCGQDETLYEFASFFAERLGNHPDVNAIGFNFQLELSLFNLSVGIESRTSKPLENILIYRSPQFYMELKMSFILAFRTIFSEEIYDDFFEDYQDDEDEVELAA